MSFIAPRQAMNVPIALMSMPIEERYVAASLAPQWTAKTAAEARAILRGAAVEEPPAGNMRPSRLHTSRTLTAWSTAESR